MMQWRVTRSRCGRHTCTLKTSDTLKCAPALRDISLSLLRFWLRSGVRSAGVPFDISNLFGLPPPPPPLSSPPEMAQGCLAVVGEGPVAGWKSVCGCCLLLMPFDILAGVLSVWLPGSYSCSDILKGGSVWAAVNVCSLLSLSLFISLSLSHSIYLPLLNHLDQNKSGRNLIVK